MTADSLWTARSILLNTWKNPQSTAISLKIFSNSGGMKYEACNIGGIICFFFTFRIGYRYRHLFWYSEICQKGFYKKQHRRPDKRSAFFNRILSDNIKNAFRIHRRRTKIIRSFGCRFGNVIVLFNHKPLYYLPVFKDFGRNFKIFSIYFQNTLDTGAFFV